MCVSDEIVERFNEYSISCSISIIPMISVSYGMSIIAIFFKISVSYSMIAMILVLYD